MHTDLPDRTFQYALRIIRLYREIRKSKDEAGRIIGSQLLRSATSVGAHVEEAQAAESKADFRHKYGIAQKEIREARYWLRLLEGANLVRPDRLRELIKETSEIYAILTSIILKMKDQQKAKRKR
jgi:four helix bundle protein